MEEYINTHKILIKRLAENEREYEREIENERKNNFTTERNGKRRN